MSRSDLLPLLNLTTLIVFALILLGVLLLFLRKRSNRHPMEGQHEENIAKRIDESRDTREHD